MQRTVRGLTAGIGLGRAARLRSATPRGRRRDARASRRRCPSPPAQPLVVIVKNIIGLRFASRGTTADRVEMRATETVRGDLQADIERARAEMQLRTESEPGRVAFRVPPHRRGRRADDGDCDCHAAGTGYSVEYDIEVRVPRGATLDVATVNDGDVTVEGVSGEFELAQRQRRASGSTGRGGSGSVQTVNGDVEAIVRARSRARRRRFRPSTASST